MSLAKQLSNFNICEAYETLEVVHREANQYFGIWKQYQALWDL